MKRKNIKIEEIINLYNQGLSATLISENLNCCPTNITRRLKKAGINYKKDQSKVRLPSRLNRHKVDEDFFNIIDSEAKAYFLGLMDSDGSVSKKTCYLKLKDEEVDTYLLHLQEILNFANIVGLLQFLRWPYFILSRLIIIFYDKFTCTVNVTHLTKQLFWF